MAVPPGSNPNSLSLHAQLLRQKTNELLPSVSKTKGLSHLALDLGELSYSMGAADLDPDRFKRIVDQTAHRVDEIIKIMDQNPNESPEQRELHLEVQSLSSFAHSLSEVLVHWEPISEKGLIPFIDHDWAVEELTSLLLQDDSTAKQQLEELLEANHPQGFICLLKASLKDPSYRQRLEDLFKDPLDQAPEIIAYFASAAQKPATKHAIHGFFVHLLRGNLPVDTFRKFFFNRLRNKESWAVESFCDFAHLILLEPSPVRAENAFLQLLMHHSTIDPDCLIILFSSEVMLYEEKTDCLNELMSQFGFKPDSERSLQRLLPNILYQSSIDLIKILNQLKKLQMGSFFNWQRSTLYYRFTVCQAYLERSFKLVSFLTQGDPEHQAVDLPVSDAFYTASCAVVGYQRGTEDFANFVIQEMEDLGVSVLAAGKERIRETHYLEGEYPCSQWLRDCVTLHENSVRLSLPCHLLTPSMDCVYLAQRERLDRMRAAIGRLCEMTFTSYGASTSYQSSLLFFDRAEALFVQRGVSPLERSFQFTFCEGGNILKGAGYILVGKDILGMNRGLLEKQIQNYGLTKQNGKWVFAGTAGERRTPVDFSLTDDDIKELLAFDHGLSSPDQVIFVEQPDYHLDVSMALIDAERKVVLLNNSLEAFEVMKERYEPLLRSEETPYFQKMKLRAILYEEEQNAKAFHLYEQQAKKDLEKAEFTVIDVAGRFKDLDDPHPMNKKSNFFNFISLKDKEGRLHIFATGVSPWLKERYEGILRENVPGLHAIHFAPLGASQASLAAGGGLHCSVQLL